MDSVKVDFIIVILLLACLSLTAADSTILFRRCVVGVELGDGGFDFAKGGTRDRRRIEFGDGAERKRVFTLSLSIPS